MSSPPGSFSADSMIAPSGRARRREIRRGRAGGGPPTTTPTPPGRFAVPAGSRRFPSVARRRAFGNSAVPVVSPRAAIPAALTALLAELLELRHLLRGQD